PLRAVVRDASGNVVPGVSVTFTPPGSGPGGTFVANPVVTTDANGVATAPAFVANAFPGGYTVTATASGGIPPAGFSLTNVQSPTITSAGPAPSRVGLSSTSRVTAAGSPTPRLTATGALPPGVTFTDHGDGTATLGGPPPAGSAGTYALTLTASNGVAPDA